MARSGAARASKRAPDLWGDSMNARDVAKHLVETIRIQKLICTRLSRWYPSDEARELTEWCVRELDKLTVELQAE
jgi:hypothetical protein